MTDLQSLVTFCEEGIPFNRLLGIRVREITEGRCELEIPVRDELIGDPDRPALHGGVTSALADAAGGFAVWSMLKDGDRASTVDIRVDYLRPGRLDRNIQAHAQVVRLGNRVAVARVTILQGDADRPIAEARGVYNIFHVTPA